MNKPIITLSSLKIAFKQAEDALEKIKGTVPLDMVALGAARTQVQKAREAIRIFAYKAKPCLSKNGKCLRP